MRQKAILYNLVALGICGATIASAQTSSELSQFLQKYDAKKFIIRPANGAMRHEYLIPAGPFTHLFDWDMYFMGVALSYDGVGKPLASSVESFLEYVDEYANRTGYTPREIAPEGFWALPEMCKPFLAQAALRASLTMGDFTWLQRENGPSRETNYVKLTHTLKFWEETRRSPDGLFRWYNGVESGIDNGPAVSDNPADVTEGVDLQCYIYREYLALAAIAGKLGRSDRCRGIQTEGGRLAGPGAAKNVVRGGRDVFQHRSPLPESLCASRPGPTLCLCGRASPARNRPQRTITAHLLNPAEFRVPARHSYAAATRTLVQSRRTVTGAGRCGWFRII